MSYLISATWWTCRSIYISVYSQYWYQHAALNLKTIKREFTVLQYSTALSSVITSFCIIFDICYMMNLAFYIYSTILPVLISKCCFEFKHYKTWIYSITVFYNTLKLNHIILYHIWYLQYIKPPFYIYSRILPVLISKCCIEFKHYKTWIHSITVFYNTLKLNHIILYHIWYLQYIKLPFYIYSRILSVWFQHAVLNLITTRREFTLLHYSKTLSSIIASFCIIFYICNILNHRFIYIPEYSQYWFQHAVLKLITTRREFTLLQYSKTLST